MVAVVEGLEETAEEGMAMVGADSEAVGWAAEGKAEG